MDLNMWCIFASLLLASAGAIRFDLGPQTFTESASPSTTEEQTNGANEIVLYLTPGQIKALEASGAVVRPDEPEKDSESAEVIEENENENENASPILEEQNQESDNNQADEIEENESEEEPEQNEQLEPETVIDVNGDIDFEEIFRLLNEEGLEAEEEVSAEEQPLNEPQVVEENVEEVEEPREIPARFLARELKQEQKQREDKKLVPEDKKARSKTYSAIRYQQIEVPTQKSVQPSAQQVQEIIEPEEKIQEVSQRPIDLQLRRFRLVPYEIEQKIEESIQNEQPAEQAQQEVQQQEDQPQSEEAEPETENEKESLEKPNAILSSLSNPDKITKIIGQRKTKLFQNELALQAALRNLKQSPKHNDQKYAIEIEKLKVNLEKQNTLARAEAIAKSAPQLIKKEIEKRRPNNAAKQNKTVAAGPGLQKSKTLKSKPVTAENAKPTPAQKKQKVEAVKAVPVEVEKRAPTPATRNVFVKVNKPYERIVPVEIREEASEVPVRKNEKITILRHIWEH